MLERFLTGLYGGAMVMLVAVALASILLGRRFELLAAFGGYGAWYFIAGWLAWTIALATFARPRRSWRITLWVLSVLFVLVAVVGVFDAWRSGRVDLQNLALDIALACAALAIACVLIVLRIPQTDALADTPPKIRATRARDWTVAARFGFVAIALIYAFWIAQSSPPASAESGAGALGLLTAFFISLPAVSVVIWFPRSAAILHFAAACIYAWLGWWLVGLSALVFCVFELRVKLRRRVLTAGAA